MVVQVDPQVYYTAATKLTAIGTGVDTATTTLVTALQGTGAMSGTSEAARTWATHYDSRAQNAVDNSRRLGQSLTYFASLVALAGYNHDLANYRANTNPNKGPEPTRPASVPAPTPVCWAGAPCSGGPGNGLVSGIATLMEKIHVHIPDGDTEKLGTASNAWHIYASNDAITNAARDINAVHDALGQLQSPEITDLTEHLAVMSQAAQRLGAAASQLGGDCDTHKKPLDDLRATIKQALEALEEAIITNLAITVFADVITAGVGVLLDAASLAKATKDVDTAATTITQAVNVARIDKILTDAAKEEDVLASTGRNLQEIESLTAEDIGDEAEAEAAADPVSPAGSKLTQSKNYGRQKQQMDHVFVPKHKLDGLVTASGGNEAAMDAIVESVQGVPEGIYGKSNPLVRVVNGQSVTIRGAMIDGVFKISTAFVS